MSLQICITIFRYGLLYIHICFHIFMNSPSYVFIPMACFCKYFIQFITSLELRMDESFYFHLLSSTWIQITQTYNSIWYLLYIYTYFVFQSLKYNITWLCESIVSQYKIWKYFMCSRWIKNKFEVNVGSLIIVHAMKYTCSYRVDVWNLIVWNVSLITLTWPHILFEVDCIMFEVYFWPVQLTLSRCISTIVLRLVKSSPQSNEINIIRQEIIHNDPRNCYR